jgi:hypothetical protein
MQASQDRAPAKPGFSPEAQHSAETGEKAIEIPRSVDEGLVGSKKFVVDSCQKFQ